MRALFWLPSELDPSQPAMDATKRKASVELVERRIMRPFVYKLRATSASARSPDFGPKLGPALDLGLRFLGPPLDISRRYPGR